MTRYNVKILVRRCLPRRKTQREVKAKLPRVERKVIVQERFTSPLNIAVWVEGYVKET